MSNRLLLAFLCCLSWHSSVAVAQSTISAVSPTSVKPGNTKLILSGKDLKEVVQVHASRIDAGLKVEKIEPTQATLDLTLPAEGAFGTLGPFGLWATAGEGPVGPFPIIVDDLPTIADNGANHSRETAQVIAALNAVDGVGDGAVSDFYRFSVAAGQRVAIEVHTQHLGSKLDPVLRLTDASGKVLVLADDNLIGPECRFSHTFAVAGDVTLEIRDSKFAPGGAYHLRVGDFPILTGTVPAALKRGTAANIGFAGTDGATVGTLDVAVPETWVDDVAHVSVKLPGGASSAWIPVLISDQGLIAEPLDGSPVVDVIALPATISGRLAEAKQHDSFKLRGTKGQVARFAARTRCIGSPTALMMQLFNAQNAKIAETAVNESDEWSFDATFPEDGEYRLEVFDLLQRGGPEFTYCVEARPAGSVSLALKADAAGKDSFIIEPDTGAAAIDVLVQRFGYDGPLQLAWREPNTGLKILNATIPAAAKEARITIATDAGWTPQSSTVATLVATATDRADIRSELTTTAFRRLKEPHVLVPAAWSDGRLAFAAAKPIERPYALEPAAPMAFAKPVKSHTATLALKRTQGEFKAPVTLMLDAQPAGWSAAHKVDKDNYAVTWTRSDVGSLPESLTVRGFSDFKGHGRIDSFTVPVTWFDPVKVVGQGPSMILAGGSAKIVCKVVREGSDKQPVTIKAINLPAGATSTVPAVTVAADADQAELEIKLAADFSSQTPVQFALEGASKYGAEDFTVTSAPIVMQVLPSPKRIAVYPNEIALNDPKARQQLVVTGYDEAGSPRDWTREAVIGSANPAIASILGTTVRPVADGATEVTVEVAGIKQTVPARVAGTATVRAPAFESEVLVALSKQNCNSGACHGSPSGKGSFRLSLRAFDKQLDELTMLREDFARRINVLEPEQSLLLLKPLMKTVHGGGKQIQKTDEAYAILRDWIASGAKMDPPGAPRCVRLEVTPSAKEVLNLRGGGRQIAATAHFSDGTKRDVTHLVAYESSNTSVAVVDKYGRVTPSSRGESVILVRFLEHIESIPLMFVDQVDGFEWKDLPQNNYVDAHVQAKLKQLQYLPSETCTDAEFLRRVTLDLIGLLPTVDETRAFLADSSPEKRSRVVDQLLERDEFAKFWALKWGDLLKMTSKQVGDDGVYKYHRWVEEAFRTNMPYDRFARELLTASGSTLSNPPANFYRTSADMNESVETISQVFIGARLQCAKCHNHPFERWTQDNYYGLGAFFQRTQRRKTERPGEMFIYAGTTGEVTQPRTGQVMKPWLPQVGSIEPVEGQDRREAFAAWLVDPKNPYFARIEANRIWSQLFARGIVDPIDDFRDSNPPTNEPLLAALADDFVKSGFDRKHLIKVILNSRTYQASCRTNSFNDNDTLYFSHQEPRLLGAEQLLDAVNNATGLTQAFANLPAGTRATQLPAPDVVKLDFLKVFGQPERSTVCACERADDSNLGMAIELFNGTLIHEKLRDAGNRFRKALAAKQPIEEIVRDMYLAAVGREPDTVELQTALEHCKKRGDDKAAGLEDVCWALLNTDEFLFQH